MQVKYLIILQINEIIKTTIHLFTIINKYIILINVRELPTLVNDDNLYNNIESLLYISLDILYRDIVNVWKH